jgi:23S rRNA (pseudouridine1915-N3)-methyltransferase
MRLLIVAVGQRLPDWAEEAIAEYRKRLGRATPLDIIEIAAEPRRGGRTPAQMMESEARRIEAALPAGIRRIVLDERGAAWTTRRLATALEGWLADGRDVAFLIGGPDGLDPALKARAETSVQLSAMTLPHAMARVLLVEQIYRARSILDNHPYHRD